MPNGNDRYDKPAVIDLINGAVIADADAPGVAVSELFAAGRSVNKNNPSSFLSCYHVKAFKRRTPLRWAGPPRGQVPGRRDRQLGVFLQCPGFADQHQ